MSWLKTSHMSFPSRLPSCGRVLVLHSPPVPRLIDHTPLCILGWSLHRVACPWDNTQQTDKIKTQMRLQCPFRIGFDNPGTSTRPTVGWQLCPHEQLSSVFWISKISPWRAAVGFVIQRFLKHRGNNCSESRPMWNLIRSERQHKWRCTCFW